MRLYFAIDQNRRQFGLFFLPFLPKAIDRKDKGCDGADTNKYVKRQSFLREVVDGWVGEFTSIISRGI